MISIEDIRDQIMEALPGTVCEVVPNPGPAGQGSLRVAPEAIVAVAELLRDNAALLYDYCSNATGIDWPDTTVTETEKVASVNEAGETITKKKTVERILPGFLEAVYHLYSVARRQGPLVLRVRTVNRSDDVTIPSLTPVWRSCELQEREIFDLYGIRFSGHPDLRRLLMWDSFEGYPMRKDYCCPEDDDWSPVARVIPGEEEVEE